MTTTTTTTEEPGWVEHQPAGNVDQTWTDVAISSDGTKLLACAAAGRLWLYDDGWTELQPAGDDNKVWISCAMSPDGSRFVAAEAGGRLYYYDGTSWSEEQPAGDNDRNWDQVRVTDQGYILAAENTGRIWFYDGTSWHEEEPFEADNNYAWSGVGLSDDAEVRAAGIDGWPFFIYDEGVWNDHYPSEQWGDYWEDCDVSRDGSVVVGCNGDGHVFVYGISAETWTQNDPPWDGSWTWLTAISVSADGQSILTVSQNGRVWLYDGTNWSEEQPAGDDDFSWSCCAISNDGNSFIAAINNGRLYALQSEPEPTTTTTSGPTTTTTPGPTTTTTTPEPYEEDVEEDLDLEDDLHGAYGKVTSDSAIIWDSLGWSWLKTAESEMNLADVTDAIIAILVKESLALRDLIETLWKGTESVLDQALAYDSAQVGNIFQELNQDSAELTDAASLVLSLRLLDALTLAGISSTIGKFQHSASDTLRAVDEALTGFELAVSDTFGATDAALVRFLAIVALSDAVQAVDTATLNRASNESVEDTLDLSPTLLLQQILNCVVEDEIGLEVVVELEGDLWECWVLNTGQALPSVYSGFAFNSFCEHRGETYAAGEDGIYKLAGETDAGAAIRPGIVLPETTFGIYREKRFRKGAFGISGTSPVIRIETETGNRTYSITKARTIFSREQKGRRFIIKVADFNELDFIELVPVILSS